jgi:hypothetical protein
MIITALSSNLPGAFATADAGVRPRKWGVSQEGEEGSISLKS